ncbi:MAG TPA: DegT/DnrJ/EryC1/StrS family aminotransferase [Verrucomicrobiae bacterium]|nr:DegT/DnrJ/EryC1/StrS family aminotransferase [Verrucomicrobiae bacterium]
MNDIERSTTAPVAAVTARQRRLTTPVPFIDLAAQHRALERPIREAFARVLEGSEFVLGEEVEAFEREFASFLGARHAIGVASGLDAITLSLWALDVGRGDEVILPANSFISTALAVSAAGAKPVLVDVDPVRYTIDPEAVAAAITNKTKAIVPVHLYGQSADMAPLKEIASAQGIPIVEDACQAHGAATDTAKCGAMSDAGCFSFYPTKNLGALGDAGMVVTDRDDIAEKIRLLHNYGQSGRYEHVVKGINSRLDSVQAAVLRVKLRHLGKWNEARRRHATHYDHALKDLPVVPPGEAPGTTHCYHLYVIRAPRRNDLRAHLEATGISSGVHYPIPIHLQPAFADLKQAPGSFPVAERLAGEILSLPIFPEMVDSDVDTVCAGIAAFYAQGATASAGG